MIGAPMRRLAQACCVALLASVALCSPPEAHAQTQGREISVLEGVNMAVVMPVDLADRQYGQNTLEMRTTGASTQMPMTIANVELEVVPR